MYPFVAFLFSIPFAIGSGQAALSAEICGCENESRCSVTSALVMYSLLVASSIFLAIKPAVGVILSFMYSILSVVSAGFGVNIGSGPVC